LALQWRIPEGLRVRRDGSWQVGDLPVVHEHTLRFLKSHLVFEEDGAAFVVDGRRRMPVEVEGPAFQVTGLLLDPARGEAYATLDDGGSEPIGDASLRMNRDTGRFECAARGGRARALFSRAAHQALLAHAEEEGGEFYLRVGSRRFPIRT
jgi:hypothetical protein